MNDFEFGNFLKNKLTSGTILLELSQINSLCALISLGEQPFKSLIHFVWNANNEFIIK